MVLKVCISKIHRKAPPTAPYAKAAGGACGLCGGSRIFCKLFDFQNDELYIDRTLINLRMIYMKTQHLHDMWSGPDNARLTSKQFSFRFPIHIAAKIDALCEMYPQKNRTQIVADLLTAALDDLEKSLPEAMGEKVDQRWNDEIARQVGKEGEQLYYLGGAKGRFHAIANRHYLALEKEMGNDSAEPLFGNIVVSASDFTDK